jgi:hypothetical protein
MRILVLLSCAAVIVGCAKTEQPPANDTTGASATPVASTRISLADVAGKWKVRTTDLDGSNAVDGELTVTPDSSDWTLSLPNRKPVPVKILSVSGDSIVTQAGPFESVLRPGVQVTTRTAFRLQDGKLVGPTETRWATSHGDSVVQRRTEGTRAP